MGYVWQQTHNVIIDGLVHEAYRDVAKGAKRGRVRVFCDDRFAWYTGAPKTRKRITCLRCVNLNK